MAVVQQIEPTPRWQRTFSRAGSLADELGGIGTWVGPRKGPNKRTQGQKEDYVLRRLLVAWREARRLPPSFELRTGLESADEPDFVMVPAGDQPLGIEITEAGDEDYQAWLTRTENPREAGEAIDIPFGPSTGETITAFVGAIGKKVAKGENGNYADVPACDLVIYDNTSWGGFLDKEQICSGVRESVDSRMPFRQVHLVFGGIVYLDLLGNQLKRVDVSKTYEIDFGAWISDQIERLCAAQEGPIDAVNIAEELASLGRKERHALASHLRNLLAHLLKWEHQPERRTSSWRLTIQNARDEIEELLTEMPSLRSDLGRSVVDQYRRARRSAAAETGFSEQTFPEECPYEVTALVDDEFFPGESEEK